MAEAVKATHSTQGIVTLQDCCDEEAHIPNAEGALGSVDNLDAWQ
jgi:hypothetical protein